MVECTVHKRKRIYTSAFKSWTVWQARVHGARSLALRYATASTRTCFATGCGWNTGAPPCGRSCLLPVNATQPAPAAAPLAMYQHRISELAEEKPRVA